METGKIYTVVSFIKLQTTWGQEAHTVKVGRFVKETDDNYYFDTFYSKKKNVIKIIDGDVLGIRDKENKL